MRMMVRVTVCDCVCTRVCPFPSSVRLVTEATWRKTNVFWWLLRAPSQASPLAGAGTPRRGRALSRASHGSHRCPGRAGPSGAGPARWLPMGRDSRCGLVPRGQCLAGEEAPGESSGRPEPHVRGPRASSRQAATERSTRTSCHQHYDRRNNTYKIYYSLSVTNI